MVEAIHGDDESVREGADKGACTTSITTLRASETRILLEAHTSRFTHQFVNMRYTDRLQLLVRLVSCKTK